MRKSDDATSELVSTDLTGLVHRGKPSFNLNSCINIFKQHPLKTGNLIVGNSNSTDCPGFKRDPWGKRWDKPWGHDFTFHPDGWTVGSGMVSGSLTLATFSGLRRPTKPNSSCPSETTSFFGIFSPKFSIFLEGESLLITKKCYRLLQCGFNSSVWIQVASQTKESRVNCCNSTNTFSIYSLQLPLIIKPMICLN